MITDVNIFLYMYHMEISSSILICSVGVDYNMLSLELSIWNLLNRKLFLLLSQYILRKDNYFRLRKIYYSAADRQRERNLDQTSQIIGSYTYPPPAGSKKLLQAM
ncbi:hypothetical protein Gasu2_12600 [Galdieria sulphuraria]|uniref:Uncharacterized protein n=1 Tax=Galdieria sulphuraria TaxID=130081 RepID=M2XZ91_GALSU|nr:uncharacterized protein Gasu_36180 [Galdieria sulphuraria]EME28879.1 hypothetical protein Gasu_36180 [Galdieria sulphuraria]GJD06871.1 hypothetical protein Gasu2_12600 [Galdieria sulphuraria]|eukprot:XP_005705399.1 hypothetical protein Gasu_36180 [Galdieria sulphuraria]